MNKQDREHIERAANIIASSPSLGEECVRVMLETVYTKGELAGHQFAIDMIDGKKEAI